MSKTRREVLDESRRKGIAAGAMAATTVVLGAAGLPFVAAVAAVPTAVMGWRWWKHRAENGYGFGQIKRMADDFIGPLDHQLAALRNNRKGSAKIRQNVNRADIARQRQQTGRYLHHRRQIGALLEADKAVDQACA